jgi:hypothetical protein
MSEISRSNDVRIRNVAAYASDPAEEFSVPVQQPQSGTAQRVISGPLENLVALTGKPHLYRGDSRPPTNILRPTASGGGFYARGTDMDLAAYARHQNASGFVSTSKNIESAKESAFGDEEIEPDQGYVYTINASVPGQRDVNAELGDESHLPEEEEIAVSGRISPSDVRLVTVVANDGKNTELATYANPLWKDR